MRRKLFVLISCVTLLAVSSGCFQFQHTVGNGPQTGVELRDRQWWALWGLVPLNEVDGGELATNAEDYRIETRWAPIDILLNLLTSVVTIHSQTVTVTR